MRKHLIIIFACFMFAAACANKTLIPATNLAQTNAPANTAAPAANAAPVKATTPEFKPGVPVEFAKACNIENNKKSIEISGYFDRGDGISCGQMTGYSTCMYRLKENSADKKGLKASIVQGEAANQAEKLPVDDKDVKIHSADGSLITPFGSKVKVTGEMSITPDGSWCTMDVTKIEKQ